MHPRFPDLLAPRPAPEVIAHRGASHHAPDNSLEAFALAARMHADWIEVDVRTTRDGELVAWHDPTTRSLNGERDRIETIDVSALEHLAMQVGRDLPRFDAVLELAERLGLGLYVDAKDGNALVEAPARMQRASVRRGIVASFDWAGLARLSAAACVYPLSVLVPSGVDPLVRAERAMADIAHCCWSNARRPWRELVPDALLENARERGLALVLWHEERPDVLRDWMQLPIYGLCTNRPELLAGRPR